MLDASCFAQNFQLVTRVWDAVPHADSSGGLAVSSSPCGLFVFQSLKKLEKRKRQSQKAWQERSDHVQQKMQDKQEKRKKNIQSRKQAKVDKKVKRAKKKGRMIPGF